VPVLEPNYYGLWLGKQSAKGTPNATPAHRLVQVAGDFSLAADDGSESYSDLSKYGATTDWVNSRTGSGEPAAEATPDELAFLLWAFHGGETVTSVTGPPAASRHTFIPSLGRGFWLSAFRRVGQNVVQRHTYNDCLITRLVIEGSTANKAVRVTPRILSLDPAIPYASDPAATLPTDKPFLYTDGQGAFNIDGVVFAGQSQFGLTIDDAWDVVYGDDTVPFELVQGDPVVTLAVTALMDANALAEWNKLVYGTAAPAAGTKPSKRVAALGSYAATLTQRDQVGALTGRRFNLTVPGVKWTIPDAPGPNPAGGATEVSLAGSMRPTTPFNASTGSYATPPYTIDVDTAAGTVAFTA
jgi:hypothetical protein